MIVYARPGFFVWMDKVYSYGPSWITFLGLLRETETLEKFIRRINYEQ